MVKNTLLAVLPGDPIKADDVIVFVRRGDNRHKVSSLRINTVTPGPGGHVFVTWKRWPKTLPTRLSYVGIYWPRSKRAEILRVREERRKKRRKAKEGVFKALGRRLSGLGLRWE